MKKLLTRILFSVTFVGVFSIVSIAQVYAESIERFESNIVIHTDSSLSVTETIVYDSEGQEKHGIYRDIRLKSAADTRLEVKDISVHDENNLPYDVAVSKQGSNVLQIKIGDPDVTFSGTKTYVITYTVLGAVTTIDSELDELYWNATGSEWELPIEYVQSTISLPTGVSIIQDACYMGAEGSTQQCTAENGVFSSTRALLPGEGVTIALGFPHGLIDVYQPRKPSVFELYWPALLPFVLFIVMFIRWRTKGKDPKGTGIIIPQYDVPGKLTPIEVAGILYQKVRAKDISAEIIHLAVQGYIKIEQTESKKILGVTKDYALTLVKAPESSLSVIDQTVLTALFGAKQIVDTTVQLSELAVSFYKKVVEIKKVGISTLVEKKYYTYFPEVKLWGILAVVIVLFPLGVLSVASIDITTVIIFVISVVISSVIYAVFMIHMPAKSVRGVAAKEYLLGLKDYLEIAEKNRLNFHNAPEKKPEVFEQLLPFAMVMGVEKKWAKEFENIYTTPPSWFVAPHQAFHAAIFVQDIETFSSTTTYAFSGMSGTSGSSGAGFSGGGGGGGGGGSW